MRTLNLYGLKKEVESTYLDVFKMQALGSVRKPKDCSNIVSVRYHLDMLTLSVSSLDEFINRVYDCFPKGSIAQMDSNIHFMRTLNVLEIIVKLNMTGDW